MKIRSVVFEDFREQTGRQTDRRGGGLGFIICIDRYYYNIVLAINQCGQLKVFGAKTKYEKSNAVICDCLII